MFSDGTIWHEPSIIRIQIFAILRRALDYLFHDGRIFRVTPLESEVRGRVHRTVILRHEDSILSHRRWNHALRGGLVAHQPAVESLTELLWLNGGMPALTRPDHLDWRTITRVAQPRIREVEAQHGEEHVEKSAEDLG